MEEREYKERIDNLEEELESAMSRLIDLEFELKNNKEKILLEFIRELYSSLQRADHQDEDADLWFEKITKEEIIENLRKYIWKFADNNKITL